MHIQFRSNVKSSGVFILLILVGCSSVFADITYTFHLDGVDATIRSQIEVAVTEAVSFYNQQGSFNHSLNIYYNSGVPTAQASSTGTIEFGGSRNTRTALHEMLHTLGVGQYWNWSSTFSGGIWQGAYANAQLSAFDGVGSQVHGDGWHFWPYGLNYDNEDGMQARYRSVRVLAALRADMGNLSILQEPVYRIVSAGGTATFSITAVGATGYAWYKQGNSSPLVNGGNISGATTNTLQITNVQAANEGRYYCVCNDYRNSRPASLMIAKTTPQLTGHWQFDGNLNDGVGPNYATMTGAATYMTGQSGQCISLDGVDDHITLPAGVANYNDITLTAWVYWNGGSQWQRIFDFGTGTDQYMFLSPLSGGNTLRFAIKNGGSEQIVETTQMAAAQWVHVAVTLDGNAAKLYVNGVLKVTNPAVTINPSDFNPIFNYIGDSQWHSDPLFNGRIDDFRIYNFALTASQVAATMAGNTTPVFTSDPINNVGAVELKSYSGTSLATYANDVDGMNTIAFSKVSGPDWLVVASDGTLSGVPGNSNVGANVFTVKVLDNGGLSDTATMNISVANIYSGTAGLDDIRGLASQWLMAGCTDTPACNGVDLDGDQDVDLADFSELAYLWLADDTLQLYLKLDETSGTTAVDGSFYGRSGVLNYGPIWSSPGKSAGSLSFDGTDDYVVIPDYTGISGSNGRTVSMWVKSTTTGRSQSLVQWGSDTVGQLWLVRMLTTNTVQVAAAGGGVNSTATVTDGLWHHIAAVLDAGQTDSSQIRLYIDGVLDAVATGASTISTAQTVPVHVGAWYLYSTGTRTSYFQGSLDEVRIYNRALTASEIGMLAQ